ncbi:MAG: methylenetetrahydrofolate reductase [Acidobacteria bacterium]|nr:methylenetetrahydrofolate reductase [Acidobacteriota bacterium]
MNSLVEAMNSGRLIVTAECLPPRGSDAEAIMRLSSVLPQRLDAVVVADNPDSIRSSAFSTAFLLHRKRDKSVVLSMATRDRNRIALMSDALGAAALGIPAIFCMSGHHQSLGICPQAAAANDLDSVQFAHAMKKMVLYGAGLNGKELEPRPDLQIGATAHPYMRPMELNLLRLKKKIKVGADFLLTQAVFDLEGFAQWMEAVRAGGLDKRTAIIPSVLPLTSLAGAKELQRSQARGPIGDDIISRISRAADAAEEGVAIAAEIAIRLKALPGVRGIHILSGGCESLAAEVIRQAGL